MKKLSDRLPVLVAAIEPLEARQLFSGLTATTLTTFTSGTPVPAGSIAIDSSGDLFGTTEGGNTGLGSVWELKKTGSTYAGAVTTLATFPADGSFGSQSRNGLVIDSKGDLFGTNAEGYAPDTAASAGVLWEVPNTSSGYGSLKLINAFTGNGGQTLGSLLTVDSGDNVLGIADGTVPGLTSYLFEYSSTGVFSILNTFDQYTTTTGSASDAGGTGGIEGQPIFDNSGNVYETTINGGTNNAGSVIEFPGATSAPITLASFSSTTSGPSGHITILNNGGTSEIFGTAAGDELDTVNQGVLWELTVSDDTADSAGIQTLGTFDGTNGINPFGDTFLMDGNLYGTASSADSAATIWESLGSNGAFGEPQTVATLPTTSGDAFSTLVSDGTDIFGDTTTQNSTVAGGTVFGLSSSGTISGGGGGGGGTATGGLTPSIVSNNLPASVIAGSKFHATLKLSLSNSLTTPEVGYTVKVFASTSSTFDPTDTSSDTLIASATKFSTVKAGKSVPLSIAISSLPASLADGAYHVIVETVDSAGNTAPVESTTTTTVAAPFVELAPDFSTTLGGAMVSGGVSKSKFTVIITNNGNVISNGITPLVLSLSTAANVVGTTFSQLSPHLKIAPGKTVKVPLPIKSVPLLADGSYYLVLTAADPFAGNSEIISSRTTIPVAEPFVSLRATFPGVPKSPAAGAIITLGNAGNIDDKTTLTISVGFTTDAGGMDVVATGLGTVSPKKVLIKSNAVVKVHVSGWASLFKTLPAGGTYYYAVQATDQDGNTIAALSPAFSN